MVPTTKKLVISGYYGFRNSGDEAVLKSILTALEEESQRSNVTIEPIVLSIDPAWTTSMHGVRAVHRMKLKEVREALKESDGLISGGGSLLQDATGLKSIPYYLGVIKLAQWLKKPTFIYAQGIGPVNRKIFNPMIRSVFKSCTYVSVRDEQSADYLRRLGLKWNQIHVVPDPVMGLPLPEKASVQSSGEKVASDTVDATAAADGGNSTVVAHDASGVDVDAKITLEQQQVGSDTSETKHVKLPVIGVSVRFWEADRKELTAIAAGLKKLATKKAVHLRFMPFHLPDDVQASRFIMEMLGDITRKGSEISITEDLTDPQLMLEEVSRCDLMIGMRLHSLIYAASQYVLPVGISYDPKIDQFLLRLESEPAGDTGSLDGDKLAEQVAGLLDQRSQWLKQHEDRITALKQEAREPAKQIITYLGRKG
ncbi:polysaccharide pyruvyl transferase CsaB [Paenibacillus silvae]|uniref:polysaccharide pyruvyl transferase CsaB n=1 Tax=Paenibacillus silvae TaxID=1325358 RepID=UPI00119F249D|nr:MULTISPECIES: polysaccharide pyruvyl transferase CsaB [Paenibacillus]MCK6075704.1 polysaccharide pyruvyl transferase CsaB [Paenibacillus silvae]MCK6150092.1 polysaccharide pyruvyl transferase CsaB [Paenibacillus silvae]MCK6268390.1 polysaccharide pyruvyl transferase CsaB [Paenibacillus silvae]